LEPDSNRQTSIPLTLMDLVFNCPKCGQELEVDAAGAGQEINCPACSQKIMIPEPAGAPAGGAPAEAKPGGWGTQAASPIASSAAAKIEKHLKVPVTASPTATLIAKPLVPLEVAAKESDRHLKIKSIRHLDCVEVGHDRFDETVEKFLVKIGEANLVSLTTVNYSHVDISSQKILTDYGVIILFRG
jgi:DNA-directed RNA polymerase subunit RPC12/RpoP